MKNLDVALDLDALRALLRPKTLHEKMPFSLLPDSDGIPRGAITELIGQGKTEATVHFLKEHKDLKVAWLEKNFSLQPSSFLAKEVALDNILFIEAKENTLWATLQVIHSGAFHVVVLYQDTLQVSDLRKLQLASEKAGVALVWLSKKTPPNPWPISLRLQAFRDETENIILLPLQKRMT